MEPRRRALRHEIRDGLVRAILAGDYGPGERLVEMRIAREYRTSQAPVREALRELEALGFVLSQANRGTYVRDPWQRGMIELYEVRAGLEELATRLATPVLSADVSSLQAEVDAMADAARRDEAAGVVEHSKRFHQLIVEASGNKLLANVWSSLHISDHSELTLVTLPVDLLDVALSHQPIVDAMKAADVELACRRSREHQALFEEMLTGKVKPAARRRTKAATTAVERHSPVG